MSVAKEGNAKEGKKMINFGKYILSTIGITFVLLFCVSAAGVDPDPNNTSRFFSEPMSMVFQGVVLIGAGSIIKSKSNG